MSKEQKNLFIAIDSHAIVHRAFHAYPPTLQTSTGLAVNALYGFTVMLLEVLQKFDPKYIVCAFDTAKPTFRHAQFAEYKAQRKPHDESLIAQFPMVEEIVRAFNIPVVKKDGYEADDILGTLSKWVKTGKWGNEDIEMIIVSGDRDLFQIVGDNVNVCLPLSTFNNLKVYNRSGVYEKMGVYPEQIVDYKGIVGDASDNIPGIKGVGEKSAVALLNQYSTMDDIYKHLAELKPRVANLFKEGLEQAEFSRGLAKIDTDVELGLTLDKCIARDFSKMEVVQAFTKYEFRSLINKIPESDNDKPTPAEHDGQLSIFDNIAQPRAVRNDVEIIEVKESSEMMNMLDTCNGLSCIYSPKETPREADLFIRYKMEGKHIYQVIHNNPQLLNAFFKCFTNCESNRNRETYFYKWEEYVSQCVNGYDDMEALSVWNNTIETVWDVFLAAHLLYAGRKCEDLQMLAFDFLSKVVDPYFDRTNIDSAFSILDEVVQAQKAEFIKNKPTVFKTLESINVESQDVDINDLYDSQYGIAGWDLQMLETKVSVILAEMERKGLCVDIDRLRTLKTAVEKKLSVIEKNIYDYVGHEFNIDSPKQLSEVLYSQLRIPTLLTGKKARSTREGVLEELQDASPVINYVLEYREHKKLLSTYIDAFLEILQKKGRNSEGNFVIHTDFKQTGTSSGRLSSINPNMQNLPLKGEFANEFRQIFVARKGYSYVSIDYAQIEFRIMAHISKDESLIKDFKEGRDIHRATASRIFYKDESDITTLERKKAKTINFGILYGQTPYGLAKQLKIPQAEAAKYIADYFGYYRGVAEYIDKASKDAMKHGCVETIFGRTRYISGLDSRNKNVRDASIREAVNMPIQGSAADLMKLAMVNVFELIKRKYLSKVFLLLQVHDELILEVKDDEVEDFGKDVVMLMENVIKLNVPLEVHFSSGKTLAELK